MGIVSPKGINNLCMSHFGDGRFFLFLLDMSCSLTNSSLRQYLIDNHIDNNISKLWLIYLLYNMCALMTIFYSMYTNMSLNCLVYMHEGICGVLEALVGGKNSRHGCDVIDISNVYVIWYNHVTLTCMVMLLWCCLLNDHAS